MIRGTTSLLLSAHASKKLHTSPALTPWAERHLHGMCTQYRCTGPGYVVFSDQNDVEGARRTLFHTIICSGISTGAVISVVPRINNNEEHRRKHLHYNTFLGSSPSIQNHLLLNAVVFRFTSWASPVTAREVDWPCLAQFYVFGCDVWTRG